MFWLLSRAGAAAVPGRDGGAAGAAERAQCAVRADGAVPGRQPAVHRGRVALRTSACRLASCAGTTTLRIGFDLVTGGGDRARRRRCTRAACRPQRRFARGGLGRGRRAARAGRGRPPAQRVVVDAGRGASRSACVAIVLLSWSYRDRAAPVAPWCCGASASSRVGTLARCSRSRIAAVGPQPGARSTASRSVGLGDLVRLPRLAAAAGAVPVALAAGDARVRAARRRQHRGDLARPAVRRRVLARPVRVADAVAVPLAGRLRRRARSGCSTR